MIDRNATSARRVRAGLTLVEMLVAMAITLLIMAAVVTVFANVSGSVTRRRATIEMASALSNVRRQLARDLAGATCPAVPWQRPESNVGYLEVIEGPQNDYYPSIWLWDGTDEGSAPDGNLETGGNRPGIDLSASTLPGSDLGALDLNEEGRGLAIGSNQALDNGQPTDGRGLGDADDILMFTTRSEDQPFVGRIPRRLDGRTPANSLAFDPSNGTGWLNEFEEAESSLAEVVWFALENPAPSPGQETFAFGEPGYRTIYRRALLILPELDYGITVPDPDAGGVVRVDPGVVRVLPATYADALSGPNQPLDQTGVRGALAALIAFQERYDLSVRLEWDPLLPRVAGARGRWVLKANTLADLTKRENRYEHHGYSVNANQRAFPFAAASGGFYPGSGSPPVALQPDPDLGGTLQANATTAIGYTETVQDSLTGARTDGITVAAFNGTLVPGFRARPLAFVNLAGNAIATARAVLDENGRVVHVTPEFAPLGGARRGDDVMITDALGFDLRCFDPGAPTYAHYQPGAYNGSAGVPTQPADQILAPGDPAWPTAYELDVQNSPIGDGAPRLSDAYPFAFERQGAYVDLGYGVSWLTRQTNLVTILNPLETGEVENRWAESEAIGARRSPFYFNGLIRTSRAQTEPSVALLTRRYATYDTWSWHYENNGVNEDGDFVDSGNTPNTLDAADRPLVDEGSNGLDDVASDLLPTNPGSLVTADEGLPFGGPDDYAERETRPPYNTALRGLQVALRVYERDSRQIREVKVRESFVPE